MNAAQFAVYSRREWRAPVFRFPAAHYEARPEDATIDGSNRAILQYDKSGNSAVNVLCLNGVAGNYASAPHSEALDITGDIDLRADVALKNWSSGSVQVFVGKYTGTGDQRSYRLFSNVTGGISIGWSTLGTSGTVITGNSTVAVGLAANSRKTIRATLNVSNGGGVYEVNFYTSDDGLTWTQLGTTVTGGAATSIFSSSATINVGASFAGTSDFCDGNIYRAQIYNGIDGTLAFDFDPSVAAKLAGTVTERSANAATVTINSTGDTGARIAGARDLAQFTSTKMSVYTAPTANGPGRFTYDGANDYSKSPAFALGQPVTVYFVGSQVTWTVDDTIYDGGTDAAMILRQGATTPALRIYAGSQTGENAGLAVATNGIVSTVFNGAASSNRVNRGTAVTGNAGTLAPNGITLGARGVGSNYANITVSEILAYPSNHDEIAQQRVARDMMRRMRIPMAA
jgi:hypothetical protein